MPFEAHGLHRLLVRATPALLRSHRPSCLAPRPLCRWRCRGLGGSAAAGLRLLLQGKGWAAAWQLLGQRVHRSVALLPANARSALAPAEQQAAVLAASTLPTRTLTTPQATLAAQAALALHTSDPPQNPHPPPFTLTTTTTTPPPHRTQEDDKLYYQASGLLQRAEAAAATGGWCRSLLAPPLQPLHWPPAIHASSQRQAGPGPLCS